MDYFERCETRPGLTLRRIKEILWETIKTFGEERLPLWTRDRYGLNNDRVFVIGDNGNMEIKCLKGLGTELDTYVRIAGPSYGSTFGTGVCLYVNGSFPFIKITEEYIIYRPDSLGRMVGDKDYKYKPGSWLVGDTLKDFVSLIIDTFGRKDKETYTYKFKQDNVFYDVDIFGTVSKVLEKFLNDKIDNLKLRNDIDIRNDPMRKLWYMFARNKETHDIVSHIEFRNEAHNILIFVDALQPIITIDGSGIHCHTGEVTTQRTLTKSEMLKLAKKIRDELDVEAAFNSVKHDVDELTGSLVATLRLDRDTEPEESARKKHASELMKQFGILTRKQISDIVTSPNPNTDAFLVGIDTSSVPPETCNFSINLEKPFIDKGDFTMKIKEVTYSGRATIVFWTDGTKTVVKTAEGETFSKDVGLAMAIAEKYFGSYSAMKSYIKKNTKDANEANAKKKQKKEKKE